MAKPETNRIVFKSDTAERKRYFKAASFAHPAKMVLGLQIYLIEHYTKPGDTILDPMAGSGTALIACTLSRNVILVELEAKFVKMQQDNYEKIKSLGPMLGHTLGQATILQGDARNLDGLLADNILFSPPYCLGEGLGHGEKSKSKLRKEKYRSTTYTDKVDAVISSPPYAGTEAQLSADKVADPKQFAEVSSRRFREGKKKGHFASKEAILRSMENRQKGCGENPKNISKLPYKADAVITSPPYEGSLETSTRNTKGGISARDPKLAQTGTYADLDESVERLRKHGRTDPKAGGPYGRSLAHPYSPSEDNIGNLKSENYLQAMAQVYEQCQKVLKPGGLLILVTKNFIRDKKIVRLDTDTIKLCEQAGFKLKERLERKLTQQSFWRTIYKQRFPDAPEIKHEDILIFKGKQNEM